MYRCFGMGDRFCLIVDDEPGVRSYLKAILEHRGIDSLEAENAAEALQLLRKCGDQIDLLIADTGIPGDMNGVDLAYSVKKSNPSLPVMLISSGGDNAPPDFELVHKPFRPAAIYAAISAVTNRTLTNRRSAAS